MKRWHWFSLTLLAVVFVAALLAVPRLGGGTARVQASDGISLVLDMDVNDGTSPCNPVTVTGPTRTEGETYQIAVCLVDADVSPTGEPSGFNFNVLYDDSLNTCVVGAGPCTSGTCLDANPDANAGTNTFGTSNLGPGYDCSIFGTAFPSCDADSATGPGHGSAFLSCALVTGVPTLAVGPGVSSPIAEVTFHAIAGGVDNLTLDAVAVFNPDNTNILSCPGGPGTCAGGTDNKTGGTPVVLPTATSTVTPGPSPTPTCGRAGLPTCTPTPKAWTAVPTAAPTETATPEAAPSGGGGGGGGGNPPPPPPPGGGTGPAVSPPSTGDGSGGVSWVTWLAISVMAGFGAISLVGGGLFLRRAGMRQ